MIANPFFTPIQKKLDTKYPHGIHSWIKSIQVDIRTKEHWILCIQISPPSPKKIVIPLTIIRNNTSKIIYLNFCVSIWHALCI
jgi:hypothetical protein